MDNTRFIVTRKVSIISAIVNALLAFSKIVIGITGQSQALIADGIHSVSDLLSDGLVVFAAKAGGQLPDAEHPYGHQRIETIATLIIALALLFIGGSILYPAIIQLIQHQTAPQPSFWVLITAIISIFANEGLFRYCFRKGKQIDSNLLISNAWHNRSDALISLIVVFSVIGAYLGWNFLDAVGATIIAAIIIKVSFQMLWQGGNELIDAAVDPDTSAQIQRCIVTTPGVISAHNLRTRTHGQNIFVDAHVQVRPDISVSEGHYIADQAENTIKQTLKNIADVAIHIDPEDDTISPQTLNCPNRDNIEQQLHACWSTLNYPITIKKISLHYLNGQVTAEVILNITNEFCSQAFVIQQAYQQAATNVSDIHTCHVYLQLSDNHE